MTKAIITGLALLTAFSSQVYPGKFSADTARAEVQTATVQEAAVKPDSTAWEYTVVTCTDGGSDAEIREENYVFSEDSYDVLKELLTADDYKKSKKIKVRLDEIYAEIAKTVKDDSDEAYEAAYAPYREEIEGLDAKLNELLEEAGLSFEIMCDDGNAGDTEFYYCAFRDEDAG